MNRRSLLKSLPLTVGAASLPAACSVSAAAQSVPPPSGAVMWFTDFPHLMDSKSLKYRSPEPALAVGDVLSTSKEMFPYQLAAADAKDHDLKTAGGLKLYALPDQSGRLNVLSFGVDNTGKTACDKEFALAIAAAKKRGLSLFVPAGFYRVEKGIDFIASDKISGFAMNMDVQGAGLNSTVFFSHGAPKYVLRINARYVTFSGFSVWGSRDQIRDSQHSAPIGIWMENMREGTLSDFKVQHIVGAGLQIDRCIVSRIDGIVYRCGSDEKRAVDQTTDRMDGCQASWVRLSCEDAHGALGGMRWLSHRNTHIDVKMENQPYHILEVDDVVGWPLRGETLTFSSGATAEVGLKSNDPDNSYTTGVQLILKNVVGQFKRGDTYRTNKGHTGKVRTWTTPDGPQFESQGTFGNLSVYANQNALKTKGPSVVIGGDENECTLLKIRGLHPGDGVAVSGHHNTFDTLDIDQRMRNTGKQASFGKALMVSGNNNHFKKVETRNSKGILMTGLGGLIDTLIQRQVFGQGAQLAGRDCGVKYIEFRQAEYEDPNSDMGARLFLLNGANTFLGIDGGRIIAPSSGQEVVHLAGNQSRLGSVIIEKAASAKMAIHMAGQMSRCQDVTANLTAAQTGIVMNAPGGLVENATISGGKVSILVSADRSRITGGVLSGYHNAAIRAAPEKTIRGVRIDHVTCADAAEGARFDIVLTDKVQNSHVLDNSLYSGVGKMDLASNAHNVERGNL